MDTALELGAVKLLQILCHLSVNVKFTAIAYHMTLINLTDNDTTHDYRDDYLPP